jgi:ATP-dependent protease Clp ATPase subunit
MFFQRKLACSFCGKSAAQVSKLVAGRGAYICNACTAEALRLMSDVDGAPSESVASPRTRSLADFWRRLVRRGYRADRESMSIAPA